MVGQAIAETRRPPAATAAQMAATDVSPFLGLVTLDGRESANAGLYRTLPLRQLPSTALRTTTRYRAQRADQLEGGLFGVIEAETVKPLDLTHRQIDIDARMLYAPYAARAGQGPGTSISGSYVDQFDTGIGRIGVMLGVAATDASIPNDFYDGSTALRPCNSVGATTAGNCSFTPGAANPTYYAASSATFRQQRSDERQRGFVGSLQWQPDARWDVRLDGEHATDTTVRNRSELDLLDGARAIVPLAIAPSGALLRYSGESAFDTTAFRRTRADSYSGGGLHLRYRPASRLTLFADLSYSRMHRSQDDISASFDSNTLFGPGGRIGYTLDQSNHAIPSLTFAQPIDLTNHDAFTASPAARRGVERQLDQVGAATLDAAYQVGGIVKRVKLGLRYSEHRRRSSLDTLLSNGDIPLANAQAENANCRAGQIVRDWGKDAGTNVNQWAVFDAQCLYSSFTGSSDPDVGLSLHSGGSFVARERVLAGYVMSDLDFRMGGIPISGDAGVRYVQSRTRTRVTHVGSAVETQQDTGDVIDLLPSVNLTAKLAPAWPLKLAAYRTLLRTDLEGLGVRRIVAAAAPLATAAIPQRQRPLTSWNFDASVEHALDVRTEIRLAGYYKLLSAAAWPADTIIAGGPQLPVALASAVTRGSYIRGIEIALDHHFANLPAPLDGLGVQASYAFNDSNFRFYDPTSTTASEPLALFTPPASIPGLSRHLAVVGGEYDKGPVVLHLTYRYRSGYFRPTGLTSNRVLRPTGYLDLLFSYALHPHVQIRLQAVNLTDEHDVLDRPVADALGQISNIGRSFTIGIRFRQ